MKILNERCRCGGKFEVEYSRLKVEGHVGCVTLVCSSCKCERKWESSEKFRDGSFKINREAVCAWIYIVEELHK